MNAGDDFLIRVPFGAVSETHTSPRYSWACDNRGGVPFVIVQLTLSGCGQYTGGGKVLEVPAGHAFLALVPSKDGYAYPPGATEPWRVSWLNLYGELGLELSGRLQRRFGPVLPLPASTPARELFESLVSVGHSGKMGSEITESLRAYEFLLLWKTQLENPLSASGDAIEAAIEMMRGPARGPLTIKEISDRAGLSREHFTRLFRERTGVSPARFLKAERLRQARELMQKHRLPLAEVALRCGFTGVRQLKSCLGTGE